MSGKIRLSDQEFQQWLYNLQQTFVTLSEKQKTETLMGILAECGCEQLSFLTQVYIPNNCQVDFVSLLPSDISILILQYLDGPDIKACSLVKKSWYDIINSSKDVWLHLFWKAGGQKLKTSLTSHKCRMLYNRQARFNHILKREVEFEKVHFQPGGVDYTVKCFYYREPYIATCSENRTVYMWNVKSNLDDEKKIEAHSVCQMKFDEDFLYTASYDNTAATWEIESGRLHCRYIGHTNGVMSLDPLRSKGLMVTGAADATIKFWNFDTGQLLRTFSQFHSGWIKQIKLFPSPLLDHVVVLSSDTKGKICIWYCKINDDSLCDPNVLFEFPCCLTSPVVTKDNLVCISADTVKRKQARSKSIISFYKITTDMQHSQPFLAFTCVQQCSLPVSLSDNRTLLGVGNRFAIFHVTEEIDVTTYSYISIVDLERKKLFATFRTPHESQYGEPPCLGDTDWLDGFTETNIPDFLLAVNQYSLSVVTLYYPQIKQNRLRNNINK